MIRDYYAVEQEYKAIEGKEAREAYIKEREKIVQEIENVGSFEALSHVLLHLYTACRSLRGMGQWPNQGSLL